MTENKKIFPEGKIFLLCFHCALTDARTTFVMFVVFSLRLHRRANDVCKDRPAVFKPEPEHIILRKFAA